MSTRWVWKVVACPSCGGRLRPGHDVCRCARCGPYPVVGEVPLLVPAPADYCASFRESLLAALSEHDLATREAVRVVQAFAEAGQGEAQRFGDDWTAGEVRDEVAPLPVAGPASAALEALAAAARGHGPAAWLGERLGPAKVAVELGCGAGERAAQLARSAKRLVVADFSLRAVLKARARAFRGEADVAGVVMDAEALALAPRSMDAVVAENVVDLLEEPARFLDGLALVLSSRGRAWLTTPQPELRSHDETSLDRLFKAAGLEIRHTRDGLPWLRVNSRRHLELYLVKAVELGLAEHRRSR